MATGDAGDTYAETPLPAENGQRHTSELFATRAPTLSIGDEEDDDDLRIDGVEHEAGWSVDGRGRSVLHVPGGRAFTAVIVEHAEGATHGRRLVRCRLKSLMGRCRGQVLGGSAVVAGCVYSELELPFGQDASA